MAMQTWLVLLLCIFFFSISVYSFISYLKDRRRQKFTGFVNGMVASHLLCHSGTINRHSLNGALLS